MTISLTKTKLLAIAISLTLFACSSDDDSGNGSNNADCNAPALIDQVAQGNFRGADFTVQNGFYTDTGFDGKTAYTIEIFVKPQSEGSTCFFPEFEGTNDVIVFIINSLETQTIELNGKQPTAEAIQNANTADELAALIGNANFAFRRDGTDLEPACGQLIINGVNSDDQLTGSVVASGI